MHHALAGVACTLGSPLVQPQSPRAQTCAASAPFMLTSPKLNHGAFLDKRYAGPGPCGGDNVFLPLQWANPPSGVKSFAVVLYDFEGGHGLGVVYWIAYGVSPNVRSLSEGQGDGPSPQLIAGLNRRKASTYSGPCAPASDSPTIISTRFMR
jgi:phosphatidylethanolamine-binding protein (PEBP) family uncharacterized protein